MMNYPCHEFHGNYVDFELKLAPSPFLLLVRWFFYSSSQHFRGTEVEMNIFISDRKLCFNRAFRSCVNLVLNPLFLHEEEANSGTFHPK